MQCQNTNEITQERPTIIQCNLPEALKGEEMRYQECWQNGIIAVNEIQTMRNCCCGIWMVSRKKNTRRLKLILLSLTFAQLSACWVKISVDNIMKCLHGSVGCAIRLETRRLRVRPPPRSATFFHGDRSWNIFNHVILSLPLIQEGQLSVSGERMCTILVNRLED